MATIIDSTLSSDLDMLLAQADRDDMVEIQIDCAECGYEGEAEAIETHLGLIGDCPECFVCFHVES